MSLASQPKLTEKESDQNLPQVKSAVRELLGDTCRSSVTEMSAGIIGREIVHLKGSLNELTQGSSRVFSAFLGVTPVDHALKAVDNPSLLEGGQPTFS